MRYQSEGHKTIEADSLSDAGNMFASIKANRLGRTGRVRACRMDSWSQDGSSAMFQAFIGTYNNKTSMTSGSNEYFHVSKLED